MRLLALGALLALAACAVPANVWPPGSERTHEACIAQAEASNADLTTEQNILYHCMAAAGYHRQ